MNGPKVEALPPAPEPGSNRDRLVGWIASTPQGALVAMAPVLFLVNLFSSVVINRWLPPECPWEPVIDAAADLVFFLPVLYVLFVSPAGRYLREREAAEGALRAARDKLEVKVLERTAALEEANERLRQESEERRRAWEAVEFQAGLLDVVEEAVVATDPEGRILYWNRYAELMYGRKAREAKGRILEEMLDIRLRDGQRLGLVGRCQDGHSWTGEAEAIRDDRSSFPVYVVCSPLDCGERGYVCVAFDMSALKMAMQALDDSEARYSTLVENAPTGIFIVRDRKYEFVNPRLAGLLGYDPDELLKIDPLSVVHPEDRQRVAEIRSRRDAGARVPEEYECRLLTKTGQVRWAAVRGNLTRFRGGWATLGTVQDITEHKQLEMELRRLSARLLTVQEEERRRLARDLHDSVGQTLTGIKFSLEAALGGPATNERRAGMAQLRGLVPAIQDAVEEVRRIATDLRPTILDDLGLLPTVNWFLRELRKVQPTLVPEARVSITDADIPQGLRTPIFRILQEAANNVLKHSNASRLTVGLDVADDALRLRVQDDGAGFSPESLRQDTEPGGFGLSSMRERAELSGGTLTLTSAPGSGTLVEAKWPLVGVVNA